MNPTSPAKPKLLALVLMACAVMASACSATVTSTSADPELQAAVVTQLEQNPDDSFGGDFGCVATATINGLGGSEIMASEFGLTATSIRAGAQITDVELPVEQARSLAEEAIACITPELITNFVVTEGGSSEQAECVIREFDFAAGTEWTASQFMRAADADSIGPAAQQALIANAFEMNATCELE